MRKCPKCRKCTMDFDDYFGRFRCFDPNCGWMPPSTAEREIRLLRSHTQPTRLEPFVLPGLGFELTPSYDPASDAFSVDFGLNEATMDLPEPDGIMIWRIGRRSNAVAGFTICRAKEGAISQISVQFIVRRKEDIEQGLRRIPGIGAKRFATRDLIDEVVVTAVAEDRAVPAESGEVERAWRQIVDRLQELSPALAPQ